MTVFGANTMAIPDRRGRPLRRRDAGRVQAPAHRGPVRRRRDSRLGRHLGRGGRRLRRREQLRPRQPRGDPRRPVAHGRERPVLARLSASRWRRGNRCPGPRDIAHREGLSRSLRSRGLRHRRPGLGRLPPLRPVHAAVRLRTARHHQGTAYGEPFAEGEAALRFEGAGVRLDGLDRPQGRNHRHRRGVCRLERRLLLQRGRAGHGRGDAGAGGDGERAGVHRARRLLPPPAAARSTCRATT